MVSANSLIFFCYFLNLILCCFIIPSESIGFTLRLMPATLKSPSYHSHLGLRSPVHREYAQFYVVKIRIGTPPIEQALLLDTGSELFWTQCEPCQHCFDQGKIPFFHPASSGSFSKLPCGQGCETATPKFTCLNDRDCHYTMVYGGGHSTSRGLVANESLTFAGTGGPSAPPIVIPGITIGCGFNNEGRFVFKEHDISGIMGLNMASVSFVSQLSDQIEGLFSYCLAYTDDDNEATQTSLLKFGDDAKLPDSRKNEVKTIDILPGPYNSFFHYYVGLDGISVGRKRVTEIPTDMFKFRADRRGGCMIDSGANTLLLEDRPYKAVMREFDSQLRKFRLGKRSSIEPYEYCYKMKHPDFERYPSLTLWFGEVAYNIKQNFQYAEFRDSKRFCVSVLRSNLGLSVIGSRQLRNMRILFDIKYKKIHFMPDNCAA